MLAERYVRWSMNEERSMSNVVKLFRYHAAALILVGERMVQADDPPWTVQLILLSFFPMLFALLYGFDLRRW